VIINLPTIYFFRFTSKSKECRAQNGTIVGILYAMRAYPKNASETLLSPTGPTGQWFFASRRAAAISLYHGPRPRQNNLLPLTGGAETSRRELESDDGRTRSERRCLVTRTEQFGYVGTWSRLSSSLLSSCGHSITFLPAYDCRSRFAVRIIIISFIVFAYYNNSTQHIGSKRYKVPTII